MRAQAAVDRAGLAGGPRPGEELRSGAGARTVEMVNTARTWLPRAVAALAFALYAWAAPAGLYWLDSGELATASAQLGVAHATGFPVYMVLAKLAALVPVGEIAFRVALVSAACAALAVAWTMRLVLALAGEDEGGADLAGALAAGVTLAASLTFARQASVVEVYAPTAALIAGALLLFWRVARGADARVGLSLALLCGLGMAVHGSFRLLLAIPVVALFALRLYRGARWPLVAPTLVLIAAVGAHLYLPLRSVAEPSGVVDWGHPATLESAWQHANATGLRAAFSDRMLSTEPDVFTTDARAFFELVADHLGPICLFAAMVGFVLLVRTRQRRWGALALAVVAAGDALYAVWINPMGTPDLQNGVPLALATCALAGIAVAALARLAGRGAVFVGAFAALAMAAGPAWLSAPALASSRGDGPGHLADAVLAAAPPGALVLSTGDSLSSALLYRSVVEGARPDVAPLVRQLLPDGARTDAALARAGIDELALGGRRPVLWELGDDELPAKLAVTGLVGPVALLAPKASARPVDPEAAARQLAALHPDAGDRIARRHHAHALTSLGRLAYGRGDLDAAGRLFSAALERAPRHAEALVNLGVVHAGRGAIAEAVRLTEAALAVAPNRVRALVNAGRYRFELGDTAAARAHAERAVRVAPRDASAWRLAGLLDARTGNPERARRRLERALALDPDDPATRRALAELPK